MIERRELYNFQELFSSFFPAMFLASLPFSKGNLDEGKKPKKTSDFFRELSKGFKRRSYIMEPNTKADHLDFHLIASETLCNRSPIPLSPITIVSMAI